MSAPHFLYSRRRSWTACTKYHISSSAWIRWALVFSSSGSKLPSGFFLNWRMIGLDVVVPEAAGGVGQDRAVAAGRLRLDAGEVEHVLAGSLCPASRASGPPA